jgi:hypothetical protein
MEGLLRSLHLLAGGDIEGVKKMLLKHDSESFHV